MLLVLQSLKVSLPFETYPNLLVLDGYSQSAKGVKSFDNKDAKSLNKSQKCIEIFFILEKIMKKLAVKAYSYGTLTFDAKTAARESLKGAIKKDLEDQETRPATTFVMSVLSSSEHE